MFVFRFGDGMSVSVCQSVPVQVTIYHIGRDENLSNATAK